MMTTTADEMVAMQAAVKAMRDNPALATGLLAIPEDAERPEVLAREDGSTVIRWFERCCDSDAHADLWWVTQSADGHTINVDHFTATPSFPEQAMDTLKYVLQHRAGVDVHYRNQVTA
ncbi:hypothetical protein LAUMK41_00485 [Mycobacterium attenuatum]|nr:hypothetical protein LAUMK41_00485 [Mycobacterium attenuatum]